MFRDKSRDFRYGKFTAEQTKEIKAAFDAGVAMCFAFDKESGVGPRVSVASKILEFNPDAILAKCDVLHNGTKPQVWKDMVLVIKKDPDSESFNRMVDKIIIPSGVVSQAIFIAKANEKGVTKKKKIRPILSSDWSYLV